MVDILDSFLNLHFSLHILGVVKKLKTFLKYATTWMTLEYMMLVNMSIRKRKILYDYT